MTRRAAGLLVLAAALATACSAGGSSHVNTATSTTQAGPTSTTAGTTTSGASPGSTTVGQPSTSTEGSPGFGAGPFQLAEPRAGLADLPSYRATLVQTFEGTDDGAAEQWTSTSVLVHATEPAVSTLRVENTGEDPAVWVETGGVEYRADGSGDCTARTADPESPLVGRYGPAGALPGVIGAEPIGHRAVAGIEADGYRFDEAAVGQDGIADTTGEVWVATDGGFVVTYDMTSTGGAELFGDGVEGTLTWHYELADVGSRVTIDLPDGCPAAPIGAPVPDGATEIISGPGLLAFDTTASPTDVLAFYADHAENLGWTAAGDPLVADTGSSIDYKTSTGYVTILMRVTDAGTDVHIVAGDAPVTSAGGGPPPSGTGTATIDMSGGHELNATWRFAPAFSAFQGTWTLTFEDPANPMPNGPFLTMLLQPDAPSLTFSEGGVTIIDSAGCTFQIDHQDASGAAGSVSCTGLTALGASSPVDLTATFDVTA
jgi:hypothetical protein